MILNGETVKVKLKNNPDLEFTHCSSIEFMERGFVKFTSEEDPTGMRYHRIINKDNIKEIYFEENVKQELEFKKALAAYNPFEKEEKEENEKEVIKVYRSALKSPNERFKYVGNCEQGGYVCPKCGYLNDQYSLEGTC